MELRDREVELKLAIHSAGAKALADREVPGTRRRIVESIYFDTADCRLKAAGYSLRLRRDRGQWVQTVKSNGRSGPQRYEHERRVRTGALDLSVLGQTPIARIEDCADRLKPVFATRVRRRSLLRDCGASKIEFSLDEGEIVVGDRTAPILELELELKSGRAADLFAEAQRLGRRDALTLAFASKSDRGYALADGTLNEPLKYDEPAMDDDTPVGAVFQAIGRACLRQVAANADLVVSGPRLEAVHQARVALRRLRVALLVFKPVVADRARATIMAQLKWFTGELEDARNLDVLIFEGFRPAAGTSADTAPMAALGRILLAAQEKSYARTAAAVESPRFRALLVETASWIEAGDWATAPLTAPLAADRAGLFAPEALDKRRRAAAKRARALDWNDPIARHRYRIRIKELRYASEFFAGLVGGGRRRRYDEFTSALEDLQDGLGRLNDLWVGEKTTLQALNLAPANTDRADYAGGIVVGRAMMRAANLTKRSRRATRAFLKTKPWW
ncbi:MAG TPA: CHAD domain-containing protein [Caulobacteraceae bacterium]